MDFNWIEGTTKVKEIVKSLATDLTMAENNGWSLSYPTDLDSITNKAVLKTKTSFSLEMYLKIERPEGALNHVLMSIGNKFINDDIDTEISSVPAKFSWYRENKDIILYDWVPVQYWISFNTDFVNIVLQGDPSMDIAPYGNYLISYGYIGSLESFEGSDDDTKYNFGITVSSDTFYDSDNLPDKYGKRTATCVTDIGMLGTRTGTPFQAHLPKFSTGWEFADKNFITASQWTHKFPMSEVVIWHAYDRERGKLQNVLVGDRSALNNSDILVMDKGKPEEKMYKIFSINAPYSILNNGPNALYGVALRMKSN